MRRVMIKAVEELEKLGFCVNRREKDYQILDTIDTLISEYINNGIERFITATKSIKDDVSETIDTNPELIIEVNKEELYKSIIDRLEVRSGNHGIFNHMTDETISEMIHEVAVSNYIDVICINNGILRFTLNFKRFTDLNIIESQYNNFIDKLGDAIKECRIETSCIDNGIEIICKKKDLCNYLDLPINSESVDLESIFKACEKKGSIPASVSSGIDGVDQDIIFSIRIYK